MSETIKLNVEEVYNFLASIANKPNNTIKYGQVEAKFKMSHNPKNVQYLTSVLNLTMMYNKLKNEPFLAALVVNDTGHPGSGFYKTLEYMDLEVQDETDFHKNEIQRVRKFNWEKWNWNAIE